MATSQAKHFWTWFQRFNTSYLKLPDFSKKEQEFWINEFGAHLRAYTKKLCFEIRLFKGDDTALLVISSRDDPKYINMAEKLVAKAPAIPNWKVSAFQPAGLFSDESMCDRNIAGINLANIWFDPDFHVRHKGRIILNVYAEMYTPVNDEMRTAVRERIVNLVGEKTFVYEVAWIAMENWLDVSDDTKNELLRIEEIVSYILSRDISLVQVDESGKLVLPK